MVWVPPPPKTSRTLRAPWQLFTSKTVTLFLQRSSPSAIATTKPRLQALPKLKLTLWLRNPWIKQITARLDQESSLNPLKVNVWHGSVTPHFLIFLEGLVTPTPLPNWKKSVYKNDFRTLDILQNISFSTAYHHNSPDRESYSQQTDF